MTNLYNPETIERAMEIFDNALEIILEKTNVDPSTKHASYKNKNISIDYTLSLGAQTIKIACGGKLVFQAMGESNRQGSSFSLEKYVQNSVWEKSLKDSYRKLCLDEIQKENEVA